MITESTLKDLTSLYDSENESTIFTEILKIKNSVPQSMIKIRCSVKFKSCLYNYTTGIDDYIRIKILEAEIRKDSLNNGTDIVENFGKQVVVENGFPGDQPEQFIGKDLGGTGFCTYNVFPLNSKLNITKWKTDQAAVYNHIKNGQNCFARLFYEINYDINKTDDNYRRPYEIYYHFKLYQSNTKIIGNLPIRDTDAKIVGEPIEGKFINLYP